MSTLLTGETIQVIDVRSCPHNHLECWYLFVASRTASGIPEKPEVVPLTEDKVSFGVKGRTNLP